MQETQTNNISSFYMRYENDKNLNEYVLKTKLKLWNEFRRHIINNNNGFRGNFYLLLI